MFEKVLWILDDNVFENLLYLILGPHRKHTRHKLGDVFLNNMFFKNKYEISAPDNVNPT